MRKIQRASSLGDWSYEVYDCKLAHDTKASTILQLSLYSELLNAIQGVLPDAMYVVPPGETFHAEQYRVLDYAAYYRYVKGRLEAAVADNNGVAATYPEPTPHCEMCKWWKDCDRTRRKDDHLSLVAGISGMQRKQLGIWETSTVEGLRVSRSPSRIVRCMGPKTDMFGFASRLAFRWLDAISASPCTKCLRSPINMG